MNGALVCGLIGPWSIIWLCGHHFARGPFVDQLEPGHRENGFRGVIDHCRCSRSTPEQSSPLSNLTRGAAWRQLNPRRAPAKVPGSRRGGSTWTVDAPRTDDCMAVPWGSRTFVARGHRAIASVSWLPRHHSLALHVCRLSWKLSRTSSGGRRHAPSISPFPLRWWLSRRITCAASLQVPGR